MWYDQVDDGKRRGWKASFLVVSGRLEAGKAVADCYEQAPDSSDLSSRDWQHGLREEVEDEPGNDLTESGLWRRDAKQCLVDDGSCKLSHTHTASMPSSQLGYTEKEQSIARRKSRRFVV